jgi:hypothetical protein
MERLGMTRVETDDFDHPMVPAGHPLKRHVLYRLGWESWQAADKGRAHSDQNLLRESLQ